MHKVKLFLLVTANAPKFIPTALLGCLKTHTKVLKKTQNIIFNSNNPSCN